MTGSYLAELQGAVLGLKDSLNAALTAAGLTGLKHFTATSGEKLNRRPIGVVTLTGDRNAQALPRGYAERVPVQVVIEADCGEPTALRYEGVAKAFLAAAGPDVAALVTDARLSSWTYDGGGLQPDAERRNTGGAWRVTVRCVALMQW